MAWNRPSEGAPKPKPKKPSALRGVVAGLVVVALAAACVVFFMGKGEKTVEKVEKKPTRIKEVTPAAAPKAAKVERRQKVEHPKTVEEALANIGELPKPMIKKREITPEEWNRITNRTYSTSTEQVMSWIFTKQLGDVPMPIPPIGEEDRKNIVAILISKNPVKESDSEKTAMSKEAVAAAKKAMIEYIKEGGDPDEFLKYYGKQLETAYEYRRQVEDQISEILEEGELNLAREFIRKANELLDEKGIKPIYETQYRVLNEKGETGSE